MTLSEAAKYQDDISRSLRIPKLVEWLSDRSVKMVYLQVQCFISAQKLSLISKASFTNFSKPSITSTPNFALWLKVVEGAQNTRKWTCGERSWVGSQLGFCLSAAEQARTDKGVPIPFLCQWDYL